MSTEDLLLDVLCGQDQRCFADRRLVVSLIGCEQDTEQ